MCGQVESKKTNVAIIENTVVVEKTMPVAVPGISFADYLRAMIEYHGWDVNKPIPDMWSENPSRGGVFAVSHIQSFLNGQRLDPYYAMWWNYVFTGKKDSGPMLALQDAHEAKVKADKLRADTFEIKKNPNTKEQGYYITKHTAWLAAIGEMPKPTPGMSFSEYFKSLLIHTGIGLDKEIHVDNRFIFGLYSIKPIINGEREGWNSTHRFCNLIFFGNENAGVMEQVAKDKIIFDAKAKETTIMLPEVKAVEKTAKAKVEKPKRKAAKPKKEYTILKGGVARVVHVFVPALTKRFEGEKDNPLCCVRRADNLTRRYMYRKVEFLGAAELSETDPLPGTNGRGICVMKTTGPLKVYH